jgi:hypothetical protein
MLGSMGAVPILPPISLMLQPIPLAALKHSADGQEDIKWRFELNKLAHHMRHYRCCVLELPTEQVAVLNYAKQLLASFPARQKQAGALPDPSQHKQAASVNVTRSEMFHESVEYVPGLRVPYDNSPLAKELHAAAQAVRWRRRRSAAARAPQPLQAGA